MLRKPSLIAALSLACAFLAPNLFAQSVAPRRAITLSEPAPRDNGEYLIDENRVKLAEAAQKQDLDALANLLLEAERLQSDSNSLKLYAVAYYGALLESTDKSPEALQKFAERVRADALARDGAYRAFPNVCRNLARYDVELAKRLYYDVVDDFVRSDSEKRQNYAVKLTRVASLRPYAPSDANVDESTLQIPDEPSADDIRALKIRSKLMLAALHSFAPRQNNLYRRISPAILALEKRRLELNLVEIESESDVTNLTYLALDTKSVEKLISLVKDKDPDLYKIVEYYLLNAYFNARIRELQSKEFDDLDSVARDLAKDYLDRILVSLDKTRAARNAKSNLYFATERNALNPAFEAAFDDAIKRSDDPELAKLKAAFDGFARFQSLVGEKPTLEGICVDGSEFSLDEYRGKAILVILNPQVTKPDTKALEALEKFPEKFAVVEYEERMSGNTYADRPWKTISKTRSNADKELGGKEFVDLDDYYGSSLDLIPGQCFLVAPDGKVVAVNRLGSGFDLNAELEKLLNEK